jgi:transcriptional regulator
MYVKSVFEETRLEVLHAHMRAHPLATLVTTLDGEIVVNHMPLLVDAAAGKHGTLAGHLPRENPVLRAFAEGCPTVAVFQGSDAYITPSWYPSKHAHGKAVPTWNYAVVHARGCPRAIDDATWLREHLERLTNEHESGQALPWHVSDAPKDFTASMIGHLVGFELPIATIVGKWKVSQNRPAGDRLGVVAGLESKGDERALAMAELVARHE